MMATSAAAVAAAFSSILVGAGLIVGEKRGRWVWYRAVPERWRSSRALA